jgi:putative colanic acid biosynthesis acetyltransferase WcaF
VSGAAGEWDENGFYGKPYRREYGGQAYTLRCLWAVVRFLLFRFTPAACFGWRRLVLRLFGAGLEPGALVYPSVEIWAPWNLRMARGSCLGPQVQCYCVAPISIGEDVTVSFRSFLCAASHDIDSTDRRLVTAPITIERGAYVFADAFVGMGVTIGEGAVVGARAVVVRDVRPYMVVAGNPAREIRERRLQ